MLKQDQGQDKDQKSDPQVSQPTEPTEPSLMSNLDALVKEYLLSVSVKERKEILKQIENMVVTPEIIPINASDSGRAEQMNKFKCKVLDEDGNTPMHLAVQNNDFRMLRVLSLSSKLDLFQANYLGKTPASLAADLGNLFVEQYCRAPSKKDNENREDRDELFYEAGNKGAESDSVENKRLKKKQNEVDRLRQKCENSKRSEETRKGKTGDTFDYYSNLPEENEVKKQADAYDKESQEFVKESREFLYSVYNKGAEQLNRAMIGAESKEKKDLRCALAGDVEAMISTMDHYKRNRDYGRAMIFSCLVAVNVNVPSTLEAQKAYIKQLGESFRKNFLFGDFKVLEPVLLDLLKSDRLLCLKNQYPKLDPITLILLNFEIIKRSGTPEEKLHATGGEKKLKSSIKSIIADAMGVKKKGGDLVMIDRELSCKVAIVEKIMAERRGMVNDGRGKEIEMQEIKHSGGNSGPL